MKQRSVFVITSTVIFTVMLLAGIGGVVQARGLAQPQSSVACLSSSVVTSTLDSGAGTLRQALAEVCTDGTITFNGDYTIYLNSQLDLTKTLTIDGSGHTVTVSGVYNKGTLTVQDCMLANNVAAWASRHVHGDGDFAQRHTGWNHTVLYGWLALGFAAHFVEWSSGHHHCAVESGHTSCHGHLQRRSEFQCQRRSFIRRTGC